MTHALLQDFRSFQSTPPSKSFYKGAMLLFGASGGLAFFALHQVLMFRLSRAGIDPKIVGQFSWACCPYPLRFLWPFVIDHIPVPGATFLGRRKAWGLWAHFFSMLGFISLGSLSPTSPLPLLWGVTFVTAFFASIQDIVSDACRFEPRKSLPLNESVTFQSFGFRCGQFLAGTLIPILSGLTGWFGAHLCVLIIKILAFFALLKLPEPSVFSVQKQPALAEASETTRPNPLDLIRQILQKPHVFLFLLSIFFFRGIEIILGPIQTIFLGQLGLTNKQFGLWKNGLGFSATLLGVVLAGRLVKRVPLCTLLRVGALAESLCGLFALFLLRVAPTAALFPIILSGVTFCQEICLGFMNAMVILYISSFCERFVGIYHFTVFSAFGSFVRTLGTSGLSVLQSQIGWGGLFLLPPVFALVLQGVLRKFARHQKSTR